MSQIIYLIKTLAFLGALGLSWMTSLWFFRTRDRITRDVLFLSFAFFLRTIVYIFRHISYMQGSAGFLVFQLVSDLADTSLLALAFFFASRAVFSLYYLGRGLKPGPASLLKHVPWLVTGLILLLHAAGRVLIYGGHLPRTDFGNLSFYYDGLQALLMIGGALLLLTTRQKLEHPVHRYFRWSILLLALLYPPAMLADHYLMNAWWVITRYGAFPVRIFISIAALAAILPSLFGIMSLLTRLRSAFSFIDVDAAMGYITGQVELSENQREVLRYFFERGWGDAFQFFGFQTVRRVVGPVLRDLGVHTLIELLHDVETRQIESLRNLGHR